MAYYIDMENTTLFKIVYAYHWESLSVWYIVKELGDDWEVIDSARSVQEAQEKLAQYTK
jgi:hypothetical protein